MKLDQALTSFCARHQLGQPNLAAIEGSDAMETTTKKKPWTTPVLKRVEPTAELQLIFDELARRKGLPPVKLR